MERILQDDERIRPDQWRAAVAAGTVATDIPANHSATFLPVMQSTLRTGTEALIVAAGARPDQPG